MCKNCIVIFFGLSIPRDIMERKAGVHSAIAFTMHNYEIRRARERVFQ